MFEKLEKHIKKNVISGRDLFGLEYTLGFDRNKLEGHKILNFGCGGSNLGKELDFEGIKCEVVDVDILPNPHTVHDEDFDRDELNLRKKAMERKVREHSEGQYLIKPVEDYENELLGIENRNFIQIDPGEKLPFDDNQFDDVFVSWVFHQIPDQKKEMYLKEFMRVGKKIYVSPIGESELNLINLNLQKSNFKIVSLLHFGTRDGRILSDKIKEKYRERGWTDDGYIVHELEVDTQAIPNSVGASGCASIILEREN